MDIESKVFQSFAATDVEGCVAIKRCFIVDRGPDLKRSLFYECKFSLVEGDIWSEIYFGARPL